MKKNRKQIGLILGAILLAFCVQYAFHIDKKVFLGVIYVLVIVAALGTILYNFVFVRPYRKRVQEQRALMEQGKTAEALQQMEVMEQELAHRHMDGMAQLCRLNMSSAYGQLKQYDKGLEILSGISDEKFSGISECVLKLNLCSYQFRLGQTEQAIKTYQDNEKLFTTYRTHDVYGGTIALIRMWIFMHDGAYDKARELLDRAKTAWDDPRFLEDYERMEQELSAVEAKNQVKALES